MSLPSLPSDTQTLAVKVDMLMLTMGEMQATLAGVNTSLQSLVRLEEQHRGTVTSLDRAFTELRAIDSKRELMANRISDIERDMPGLKELRKWVIGGIGLGVMMMLGAVFSLVISAGKQQDFMYRIMEQQAKSQQTAHTAPVNPQ